MITTRLKLIQTIKRQPFFPEEVDIVFTIDDKLFVLPIGVYEVDPYYLRGCI